MKLFKYLPLLAVVSLFVACVDEEDLEPETVEPSFTLSDASDITSNSAFLSGSAYMFESSDDFSEVGFVYGTSSQLSFGSFREQVSSDQGSKSATITNLDEETLYYYAIYAYLQNGQYFTSETMSFETLPEQDNTLSLGDTYEGGIIYYLDASGEHGLLASPVDVTEGSNWETAYDECYSYSLQGNDNWRLPDLDELEFLYERKDFIGNFADIAYWSRSVEGSNPSLAYGVFFGGGSNAGMSFVYDKTNNYQHSRAIRDF